MTITKKIVSSREILKTRQSSIYCNFKITKRLFFKTNDVFISKYIILYRYSEKIFKSICIFRIFSTQLLFVNTKHIYNGKEN